MTTSPKKRGRPENLKRGNTVNQDAGIKSIEKAREEIAAHAAAVDGAEHPDDVTLELFREAAKAALRGYRKFNRSGREPSRQQIEASKEARQLADSCSEILRARGAVTEAERFLASLAGRITAAGLEESPRPVGEVART